MNISRIKINSFLKAISINAKFWQINQFCNAEIRLHKVISLELFTGSKPGVLVKFLMAYKSAKKVDKLKSSGTERDFSSKD